MPRDPQHKELLAKISQLQLQLADCLDNQPEAGPGIVDFKGLAERSRDAIYHFDVEQQKFLFVNRPFCNFFDIKVGQVSQHSLDSLFERIHSDDRERLRRNMINSMKPDSTGGEEEYRLELSDGSRRWVHDRWIVIRDENGQARAVEGFIRDTTDLKMADTVLEVSKSKAFIGSYIVLDRKFKYVNPEFIRIMGYSAEELAEINPLELVHDDYKEYVRQNAVLMLKGERADPFEYCVLSKDGEIKWVMETVTSIQYRGRRAALSYFMDITGRRRMQHNLASLGLMVGAISHSLKGCLTGLDAALYLIDTGFYRNLPARIEEGLDTARLMIDRLSKLVYDVLYYVKERELEPEEVDVLQFTNEVVTGIATRMRGANISFSCRYTPPVGRFEIDRELIRPALLNILENAMEACIEDQRPKEHRVELSVSEDQDWVLIDIADNGPGMNEEQIRNAFSLFYSSKGKKGTGLGLFITKKVINQHGGQVTVESHSDSGTAFHIKLPKKSRRSPDQAVPIGAGAPI